ncbi:MAG TPA: ABC transporter ATP-binding protein [Kiritimatiellia bacterium]|nr:ABC transporter ATP-binding protein [Kiritimatiellia bacterium]
MLKKIHLCMNHVRRVKRGRELSFAPGLNLLLGPNGTGKSTILRAIAECEECRRIEEGPTEYVFFDAELANPHTATGPAGNYTNMILRTRALFSSHGEILQDVFKTLGITPKTCLLLDEPEAGQDYDHVLKLRAAMDRAVKRGAQIICATHEFMFWERAHFIELRRGYRKRISKAVCRMKCLNEQEDTL